MPTNSSQSCSSICAVRARPSGKNLAIHANPCLSAFAKDDETGEIFHSYSTYARGPEELIGTYMILDRAPRGRNETGNMDWMRRHDEYDEAPKPAACCAS